MSILKIARLGHPVLQQVCDPVADPTAPEIAALVEDMKDTLYDIGGTGLAGPQIYKTLRLVIVRMPEDRIPPGSSLQPWDWTVLVNPTLTPLTEEKTYFWERCLSIPGLVGRVPRWSEIKADFTTLEGKPGQLVGRGIQAMLLQHECDHLDGYTYPMRMDDLADLAFITDPGRLARAAADGEKLDPVFQNMVKAWPDRENWIK